MIKKYLFSMILCLAIISNLNFTNAMGLNEQEARFICALSSMAAYEDDNGVMVRGMLSSYGWKISSIKDESDKANAKALVITKTLNDGSFVKILSISGTSDIKDAEVDFRLHRVYSGFNRKDILVHQGFKDYSEVVLDNDFGKNLVNEIIKNPSEKLYITGHSLGGAVAIVTAANLIELGFPEESLEVITFGAPAVGNKGFAEEYKDKIHLSRVTMSGDPIKKALQSLGYVHFGEVVKYKPVNKTVSHFPHMMVVYLDCALRDFYDDKLEKPQDYQNAAPSKPEYANDELIYVAPMQIMKNSFSDDDFKYVKAVMKDQINQRFTSAVFDEAVYKEVEEVDELADFDNTIEDILVKAKAANCKYILVQYLQAKKIKTDKDGDYRVSLEEIYYDLNGFPTSMQTASVTTKELTMLEAAVFAQESLILK